MRKQVKHLNTYNEFSNEHYSTSHYSIIKSSVADVSFAALSPPRLLFSDSPAPCTGASDGGSVGTSVLPVAIRSCSLSASDGRISALQYDAQCIAVRKLFPFAKHPPKPKLLHFDSAPSKNLIQKWNKS